MNKKPIVAILLATYNGQKYIKEQLMSLDKQTFQDFVCYIHDDGSSDGTREIALEFCKNKPEKFILIESEPCGGAKDNFLFLMKQIKNEPYIMFCDQDDQWDPNKISISLAALREIENKSDLACVYTDLIVSDKNLKEISPSFYTFSGKDPYKNDLVSLLMNNVAVGCTMMITRELAKKSLEKTNCELLFMHDWWIALLASACGSISYINSPLIKYRQHGENNVGAIKKKTLLEKFSGRKAFRKRVLRSVNFAKALDLVLDNSNHYKEFVHHMASVYEHDWFYRAAFFLKKGLIPKSKFWKVFWI